MRSEARRTIGWGVALAALLVGLAFFALRALDGPPSIEGGSGSAAVEDIASANDAASDAAIEAERFDEAPTDAALQQPPLATKDREPSPVTWRAIDVVVKRATGAPVAGAAIRLEPTESFRTVASPLAGATDDSGELRLEAVAGASYDLAATIGTTTLRRFRITAPAPVVIELPELLTWRVRVEERSGLLVAGALVAVGRPGSKLDPIRATTDRSGVATLDLPVDTVNRFAFVRSPDGHHAEFATPSPLRDGTETRVVLGDLVRILGRVRHRDGAIPSDGRFEFGEGRAPVLLAPDGSFEFAIGRRSEEHALLRGSRFVDRAFTIHWRRVEDEGALRGSTIDVGELTVDASRLLSLTSVDEEGQPIEGVLVRSTGAADRAASRDTTRLFHWRSDTMLFDQTVATDPDGGAVVELPASLWVALELSHPRHATWRTTVPLEFEPIAPIVARMATRAFLMVEVASPPGLQRAATTIVQLVPATGNDAAVVSRSRGAVPLAWFDRDTAYVDGVAAGAYELAVRESGLEDHREKIVVQAGRTTVRVELRAGMLIEGRVLRVDGSAAAGAHVSLHEARFREGRMDHWDTETSSDGRFAFRSAPASSGSLRLRAWELDPDTGACATMAEHGVVGVGWYELRLQPIAASDEDDGG